jgi:acetyl-CoA acetyltransferase
MDAYITAALRTAAGRRNGRLSGWHPADLAAEVLDALVDRTGIDPAAVDDVLLGCVSQVGEQSTNVARNAVLASRLPESVPGTSIDRQCGSSQQALHFAAQAVMAGTQDVVIAAGVESMSRVPMFTPSELPRRNGLGFYMSPRIQARYPEVEFSQFMGAEMIARKYGLSVPLAWLQATGADPARLNVHGGAIALGHPLGASGAKLMTTLLNVLQQRKGRYGLQTMCEGGGMANVTIVEALR